LLGKPLLPWLLQLGDLLGGGLNLLSDLVSNGLAAL